MAILYPGALDAFTNPAASDALNKGSVLHATQHSNLNDAAEALEAKLGIGASTPVANSVLAGTGTGVSGWTATLTLGGALTAASLHNTGTSVLDGKITVAAAIIPPASGLQISNSADTITNFTVSDTQTTSRLGITIAGGNSLTMTGTIAATGARVTQAYYTNITSTNAVTVDSSLRSKVPASIVDYTGDALRVLRNLKVKQFRHRLVIDPSNQVKLGIMAESVLEPLALQKIDDPDGGEPYDGLNLMGLIALQAKMLQVMDARLVALEGK